MSAEQERVRVSLLRQDAAAVAADTLTESLLRAQAETA